jgi:hypothetical protein
MKSCTSNANECCLVVVIVSVLVWQCRLLDSRGRIDVHGACQCLSDSLESKHIGNVRGASPPLRGLVVLLLEREPERLMWGQRHSVPVEEAPTKLSPPTANMA